MQNIVILGGNFAGVSTAHYLLRHVIPLANNDKVTYKVILVSTSDHTLFKVGAPRALVASTKEDLMKPFASIPGAFADYPASSFTFILGEAVALDEKTQTITVKTEKELSVHYDSLVIATGTTSNSRLWTLRHSLSETVSEFEDFNANFATANTILIGGGGPAGVETTGEIAYKLKGQGKSITILSGNNSLLPSYHHAAVSKKAESQLQALGVSVVHNLRVISSKVVGGKTEVLFSNGTTKTVDLYIDATGGAPNTSFLPASWLDSRSYVTTESTTLRTPIVNVYALGDVASFSKRFIGDAMWSVPALGYSIYSDLTDGRGTALKEKKYKQIQSAMAIVPIGPTGGVGVLFGWRAPSWLVWLLKARTFFMEKAPGLATGAEAVKA